MRQSKNAGTWRDFYAEADDGALEEFNRMDENGDGVISKDEWLQAHGGHALSEKGDSGSIDRAIAR